MTRLSIFVSCVMLCCTQAWGAVVSAPDLDVVENHLTFLDENALVVFDIDYTLIVPVDRVLAPCGEEYWQQFVKKLRSLGAEGEKLGSIAALESEVILVNDKIRRLLGQLKSRKIKTIALSAMPVGRFGVIPDAEQWRVNQLNRLGIDFSWAFPEIDWLRLEGFDGKRPAPAFKKGMIASSKYPKGQVLVAFLKQLCWRPSMVIFIDDRMEYIESVEMELEKTGIPHISLHYTEAIDRPCKLDGALDQKLADLQFDYLIQHGHWLSDTEAVSTTAISIGS